MTRRDEIFHVETPHADLYVEDVGPAEAPVLYYLHGGPGYNAYSFRDLVGDALESFRMVYADQRGAGRSYVDMPFDLDVLADDVVLNLDALGVPRASLLAHGFGAHIAVRAALRHPHRVERLVFAAPWVSMPLLARGLQREAAVAVGDAGSALPPEESLAEPEALEPETLVAEAFGRVPAKQLFDAMQFPSPASRLRLEHSDTEALFGPQELVEPEGVWRLDVRDELAEVPHGLVVVAPTHDRTTYPDQVEAVLERAPHALVSLLDSGHYPWIDDPSTFLDLLHEAMTAELPRREGGTRTA